MKKIAKIFNTFLLITSTSFLLSSCSISKNIIKQKCFIFGNNLIDLSNENYLYSYLDKNTNDILDYEWIIFDNKNKIINQIKTTKQKFLIPNNLLVPNKMYKIKLISKNKNITYESCDFKIFTFNKFKIGNSKEYFNQNKLINDNDFVDNIKKYSNDEYVLFYDDYGVSTTHRYVPLVHALKILEYSPNKEIYYFLKKDSFNKANFNFIIKKFPNFHFYEYTPINSSGYDPNLNHSYTLEYSKIINDILKNNNGFKDKKKILFTSDIPIMNSTFSYLNGIISNKEKHGINENFANFVLPLINNFDEINLIADGSSSLDFYSDLYYDFFKNNDFIYDTKSNEYIGPLLSTNNFLSLPFEIQKQLILSDKIDVNKLMIQFLVSSKSNTFIGSKINFYIPSLNSLYDINNTTSWKLSHNDDENIFFNPYNSKNLNFISLLGSLNPNSKDLFYKTIGISNFDNNYYEKEFKNSHNIIFASDLLSNDQILIEESNKIIKIYNNNLNLNKNLKIWFKGHPKEKDGYEQKLRDKITFISKNPEIEKHLFFIDPKLPFEIILNEPWCKNNEITKTQVNFVLSFSTIILFLDAANMLDQIESILITQNSLLNEVEPYFGKPEQSLIFKSNLISLLPNK